MVSVRTFTKEDSAADILEAYKKDQVIVIRKYADDNQLDQFLTDHNDAKCYHPWVNFQSMQQMHPQMVAKNFTMESQKEDIFSGDSKELFLHGDLATNEDWYASFILQKDDEESFTEFLGSTKGY